MTPYMEQCLGTLQTSSLATPTDAVLSAWVRLQRIVDTYATVLGQTSPGNKANLSNPSIKLNLHNATKQLQEWKTEVAETLVNGIIFLLRGYGAIADSGRRTTHAVRNSPLSFPWDLPVRRI